jgi:hypothetical protein
MCKECEAFSERLRLNSPREYLDVVRQVDELLTKGVLRFVRGTSTLKEIRQNGEWSGDAMTHIFECPNCAQQFRLAAETFHGSGTTWEKISIEERKSVQ